MMEDNQFRHTLPVQIRFSDVDQFGHVNNSVYFSLYDLAKTTYVNEVMGHLDWNKMAIVVANINADFLVPVFFNEHLAIETRVTHLGHKSFTLEQRAVNPDDGVVKCVCTTVMVAYDVKNREPILIPDDYRDAVANYEGVSREVLEM